METRLSESQAEAEELNQSQKVETCIVIVFIPPLLLPTPKIWFSLDRKRRSHRRSRKKRETFWFFRPRFRRAYDSATTPIFDFDLVISALTTSPKTPTPSLVKTGLKEVSFTFYLINSWCFFHRRCKLLANNYIFFNEENNVSRTCWISQFNIGCPLYKVVSWRI